MAKLSVYKKPKSKGKFTQASNDIIFDSNISGKAKSIMFYFLSLPEDWKFNINHLLKAFKEGKKALYEGINELIDSGYIKRVQEYKSFRLGEVHYIVSEIPFSQVPHFEEVANQKTGDQKVGIQETAKDTHINTDCTNTDLNKINFKNTSSYKEISSPESFSEPEIKDDDAFLENFVEEYVEDVFIETPDENNSVISDNLKIEQTAQETVSISDYPAKTIPGTFQAIGNFVKGIFPDQDKKSVQNEIKKLKDIIANLTYKCSVTGKEEKIYFNTNLLDYFFDMGHVKDVPIEQVINDQIKWFPYRFIDTTKHKPCNVLYQCIRENRECPKEFIQIGQKEEIKEQTQKYAHWLKLWSGASYNEIKESSAKTIINHEIKIAYKKFKSGLEKENFIQKLKETVSKFNLKDCFIDPQEEFINELLQLVN